MKKSNRFRVNDDEVMETPINDSVKSLRETLQRSCSFGNRLILETRDLEEENESLRKKMKKMKRNLAKMRNSLIKKDSLDMEVWNLEEENRRLRRRLKEEKKARKDLNFRYVSTMLKRDFQAALKNKEDSKLLNDSESTISSLPSRSERKVEVQDFGIEYLKDQSEKLKERRNSYEPTSSGFKTPTKVCKEMMKRSKSVFVSKKDSNDLMFFVKTPSPNKRKSSRKHRSLQSVKSFSLTPPKISSPSSFISKEIYLKYGNIKQEIRSIRNENKVLKKFVKEEQRYFEMMTQEALKLLSDLENPFQDLDRVL